MSDDRDHRFEDEERAGPGALTGEAAAILGAYRRAIDPPPGASAAIWRAIAAREAERASTRGRARRGVMIAVAAAAAVLLGIAAQVGTELGRERPTAAPSAPYASEPPRSFAAEAASAGAAASSRPDPGDMSEETGNLTAGEAATADAVEPGPAGDEVGDATDLAERAGLRSSARAGASARRPGEPSRRRDARPAADRAVADEPPAAAREVGPDPLAAEMALIAAAEAALRRGDAAGALRILDRHGDTFPKGQLEPEREASRVTALCAQARPQEAHAVAGRFLARWPASHLARRVRESCGGIFPDGSPPPRETQGQENHR